MASLPLNAEEVVTRDLRVTDAAGPVTIEPVENPSAPAPVDEDTPLKEGDVVAVTGPNSRAELTMDGETVFRLQPGSRFKVLKIFSNNTQFELSQGEMLAKVKPVAREDEAMLLKMPTAVVAIRGTEFGAETGDGVSHVGVFDEGHVVVAGVFGHEHVVLGPNQETHVPLSYVPVPPQTLLRFKARRAQMAHVRNRLGYWRQHWEPIGPDQRQRIRDRINTAQRFPSRGFSHPTAKPAVPHVAKPKTSRPLHARKVKPGARKTAHRTAPATKHALHRATPRTKPTRRPRVVHPSAL